MKEKRRLRNDNDKVVSRDAEFSKPLSRSPREMENIHFATLDEHKARHMIEGQLRNTFDWWYQVILQDDEGYIYHLVNEFSAFPGESIPTYCHSFFARIEEEQVTELEVPDLLETGKIKYYLFTKEDVGYREEEDSITMWYPEKQSSDNLTGNKYVRYRITEESPGKMSHDFHIHTDGIDLELKGNNLGIQCWWNKGKLAKVVQSTSDWWGFEEFIEVEGRLILKDGKTVKVKGYGNMEHLYFDPYPSWVSWKTEDWIPFYSDKAYGFFTQFDHKYEDGAIVLRESGEYLIPTDFNIEVIKRSEKDKVELESRLTANTLKGKLILNMTTIGRTRLKYPIYRIEGQFKSSDGRIIPVKGYAINEHPNLAGKKFKF